MSREGDGEHREEDWWLVDQGRRGPEPWYWTEIWESSSEQGRVAERSKKIAEGENTEQVRVGLRTHFHKKAGSHKVEKPSEVGGKLQQGGRGLRASNDFYD